MTTDQAIKILNGSIKKPNTKDGYLGQAITMAIEALKNELVRCKDCKYYNSVYHQCGRQVCAAMNEDDYCSYRKLRGASDDSN